MDDNTLKLTTDLWLGKKRDRALVSWATEVLASEKKSQSLVRLAGLTEAELPDARLFFSKALGELGYDLHNKSALYMKRARKVAQDILDGATPPNDGCALIAEICKALDWPNELDMFYGLAHDQCSHEHLGFTAESLIPAILEAAGKLIESEVN